MDPTARERVARLMERMAGGDIGAAFELGEDFDAPLRHAVRRVARSRHRELSQADLDELVVDTVLVLHDVAAGWDPAGGALPWVWAERRIANAVDRHLGLFVHELDEDRLAAVEAAVAQAAAPRPGHDEPSSTEVLDRLAGHDERARCLAQALDMVASPRDRELWLEVTIQEWLGDRSPAATVGGRLGISPEAVRQQRRRIGCRLGRLAAAHPDFAPLRCLVAA